MQERIIYRKKNFDEAEKKRLFRKRVMTSRNDMLSHKLSLKKFVINSLRKKCDRNFGKKSSNIPTYLIEEMKQSMKNTMKEKIRQAQRIQEETDQASDHSISPERRLTNPFKQYVKTLPKTSGGNVLSPLSSRKMTR